MKLRLLFFCCCFSIFVQAQYHLDQLSDSVKVHLKDAWYCWNETEDSCIPFYQKFVEATRKRGECVPCAEVELARGYHMEGMFKESVIHALNVIKDAEVYNGKLKDELQQDAYNTLGQNYMEMGEMEQAIQNLLKSKVIIGRLGVKQYSAVNKVNLGVVYALMNDCSTALQYYKDAYAEFTEIKSNRTAHVAKNILGEYINCTKPDSALYWGHKAIFLAKKQNDGVNLIASYALMGEVYSERQPDSALFYIDKALDLEQKHNIPLERSRVLSIRGNIMLDSGNYTEAKKSYLRAIEIAESVGDKQDLNLLYEQIGRAAVEFNDAPVAATYLLKFIGLNKEINSEEIQKTVRELNLKYDTEKKEKQLAEQKLKLQKQQKNIIIIVFSSLLLLIVLLGIGIFYRKLHRNRLKQLQQEKENAILTSFIQGEERERNRISYELHDGVAAMIGAAKMSLETIPFLPQEKQKEHIDKVATILENTHADVRYIAHNLLPVTLEKEGIIEATEQFAAQINESKLISISVTNENSDADKLPVQMQLMLFRIIQELVNNVIKHSQAQEAVICFSKKQDGLLQIEVTDDGIGFDGGVTTDSQGLYSIGQRMKSIGGNFTFVKKQDKGMRAVAEVKI